MALGLVSCRSVKNAASDNTTVSYELVQKGNLMGGGEEGIEESVVVCTSQSELDAIKKKMNSVNYSTQELDQQSIDFKKQTVIGYFQPIRSSGGYTVEVQDFKRMEDSETGSYLLQISVTAPQGPAITVITQPYLFLITEKIEGKVEFETNEL